MPKSELKPGDRVVVTNHCPICITGFTHVGTYEKGKIYVVRYNPGEACGNVSKAHDAWHVWLDECPDAANSCNLTLWKPKKVLIV